MNRSIMGAIAAATAGCASAPATPEAAEPRRVTVELNAPPSDAVLSALRANPAVASVEVAGGRGDLETVFLALTGRSLRD